MERIAISHPGKIGDALYSIPIIRYFTDTLKMNAHFYTSEYCRSMKRLMEYQSCIDHVIIPESYEILRMDVGVQPWEMPIDTSKYARTVHLGFRSCPYTSIPIFMARQAGANVNALPRVYYEYPEIETLDEPYICIAPRGNTTYLELFRGVAHHSKVAVVIVGGVSDHITDEKFTNYDKPIIELIGLDFLETTSWIAGCVGFTGLMSAPLVLANGFDMPKVIPHDNIHWDMSHVLYTDSHKYMVLPTVEQVLGGLGI